MNTQASQFPPGPGVLYRLLSVPMFFAWLAHAVLHALKHRVPVYMAHRLGFHRAGPDGATWLHAASVGEVRLIEPLVSRLLRQGEDVVVTTFTATGYREASRLFGADAYVHALPIDFIVTARRFATRTRWRLGLVAETELWPELLYQCRRRGVALAQVNARLSVKSLDAPRLVRRWLENALSCFALHLTRTVEDRRRLERMGVAADNIRVVGNLKFATATMQHEADVDLPVDRYLLFASTHDPEERLFAGLIKRLPADVIAVMAPRHPGRAPDILRALRSVGLDVARRSTGDPVGAGTRVYLADTLGELRSLMSRALLIVMGGSFDETGGHNVLEGAAAGKVVLTGPSDANIHADIAVLAAEDAIVQVADVAQLERAVLALLEDDPGREAMGERARRVIEAQAGVLDDYLAALSELS